MNQNQIFFPCFALMILTFIVLIRMFIARVQAVAKGEIEVKYFKTFDLQSTTPILMTQASRNFTNLFEVPTLFYMICVFALITQNVDPIMYKAAWLFVALRFIHSVIHLTNNKIYPRMSVYGLSWIVLITMGFLLTTRIIEKM